ncbi:hypothetical protein BHE74_00027238 [Ensete ventricosum]|nr:hypothetical protein BHE74_00027238 [Ensete ventricosum]
MSHPRYSTLLGAFVDCQKVGAPPEVVERLSAITHALASRPSFHSGSYPDPELDQFMVLIIPPPPSPPPLSLSLSLSHTHTHTHTHTQDRSPVKANRL